MRSERDATAAPAVRHFRLEVRVPQGDLSWSATLCERGTPGPGQVFGTPLDLARHLARLTAPADPGGLR